MLMLSVMYGNFTLAMCVIIVDSRLIPVIIADLNTPARCVLWQLPVLASGCFLNFSRNAVIDKFKRNGLFLDRTLWHSLCTGHMCAVIVGTDL